MFDFNESKTMSVFVDTHRENSSNNVLRCVSSDLALLLDLLGFEYGCDRFVERRFFSRSSLTTYEVIRWVGPFAWAIEGPELIVDGKGSLDC